MSDNTSDTIHIGFDLGGTKMLGVAYDGSWAPIARRRKRTKGADGAKAGVKRIVQMIDDLLNVCAGDRGRLASIGIGCPGPVNLDKGIVIEAVNLGWFDVKLQRILEDEFGCAAAVLNDVDAGLYGESLFGAATGARTALGVFPGTGIGGGCVYDGQILRGKGISCMEIGHIRVQADGPLCGCGNRGCLETVASRLAISAEAAKAVYRGQAPVLRELAGTDLSAIRSGILAKSISGGDKVIKEIMVQAAQRVGEAVANLVHVVAPDLIVLGGGLVEAVPELWIKNVESAATRSVMSSYRGTFQVKSAKLGDDATVLGAAAFAGQPAAAAKQLLPANGGSGETG